MLRALPLLALAACLGPEGFEDTAATTACRRARQCDTETFDRVHLSVATCAADHPTWTGSACRPLHCALDRVAARRCVTGLRNETCPSETDPPDTDVLPCEQVWTACDANALRSCLVDEAVQGPPTSAAGTSGASAAGSGDAVRGDAPPR